MERDGAMNLPGTALEPAPGSGVYSDWSRPCELDLRENALQPYTSYLPFRPARRQGNLGRKVHRTGL